MLTAVVPATRTSVTPSSCSQSELRSRSSCTSSAVDGAVWPSFGTSATRPVSAPGLGVACMIATTSGTSLTFFARSSTVLVGSVLVMMLAVTESGEL